MLDLLNFSSKDRTDDRSGRRYRRIWAAILTALFGKGTSLIVSVIIVPLTVRYLGAESYGLWVTISSTVAMFFLLDLGIASTLTNLISEAYATDDKRQAGIYFATALWVIIVVAGALGVLGWLIWPHINWASLFHLQSTNLTRETSEAVAAAFFVFLLSLPFNLAIRILSGYQELHVANFFATGGSVLSLVAVIVVIHFRGGLPFLVAAYAGSTVFANAACLTWICFFYKPWMKPWPTRIDPNAIGRIFHTGIQFFAIQLAGLVVFNSDNLIIAHYLSPAQVTPYSVTWRLVGYLTAIQSLIIPSLWPAFSEAWSIGNMDWIRSTYRRLRWITVGALSIGSIGFLTFGRQVIRIWAGPSAVPSPWLLRLMCLWMILLAITANQACLMGATNRVKKQAISSGLAALVNLGLSIIWVRSFGLIGVLLATIVSYVVFILFVQVQEVRSILQTKFVAADN